jgi:hypothetical protein
MTSTGAKDLLTLPAELILDIGGFLKTPDIAALIRTSHLFHALLTPVLHKRVSTFRTRNGETVLHRASRLGEVELIKLGLSQGVPVNAANTRGMTALHYAASSGHVPSLELLLDAGADVHATAHPDTRFLNSASNDFAMSSNVDAVWVLSMAGEGLGRDRSSVILHGFEVYDIDN